MQFSLQNADLGELKSNYAYTLKVQAFTEQHL